MKFGPPETYLMDAETVREFVREHGGTPGSPYTTSQEISALCSWPMKPTSTKRVERSRSFRCQSRR